MSGLQFSLAAFLVILGFGFLSFSARMADRLGSIAIIVAFLKVSGEPLAEILKGIGMFTVILGTFILLAMTGSVLLAKGVLLFLPV